MKDVRPGQGVEFMYHDDYATDRIYILRAVIYDVQGKQIILSQSQPLTLPSSIGRDIVMTYLAKDQGQVVRFGFSAVITDFINHYELASRERVAAVVVARTGATERFNIRLHYRLKVPSDGGLTLSLEGQFLNLIDISIGGSKFSCPTAVQLIPQGRIRLILECAGERRRLDAEVLRVWSSQDQRIRKDVQYASVRFIHIDHDVEQLLGKEIFRIERQLLAECRQPD